MHVDSSNLVIVVGSIIADTGIEIVARGINRDFVFVVAEFAEATGLVDGMEDVEELADAAFWVVWGNRMGTREGGANETRLRS